MSVPVSAGLKNSGKAIGNSEDRFLFDGSEVIVKLTDPRDRNEKPLEFKVDWRGQKKIEHSAVLHEKYREDGTPIRGFDTKLTVQCMYISPDKAQMDIIVHEIR